MKPKLLILEEQGLELDEDTVRALVATLRNSSFDNVHELINAALCVSPLVTGVTALRIVRLP